jgi:glucosamine--fructose-6-phosphate aminotransferase (isomerizing)
MSLLSEILSQPDILARALQSQRALAEDIAAGIRAAAPQYVFLAARGTSDNAGRYANYLWGTHNRIPVALAAPSLFTIYQSPPILAGVLVVGISQSGQSPDIVSVLEEARRQRRPTLALTNDPNSPLARAADWVFPLMAGEEKAVAATKTYTAELLAIATLSAALEDDSSRWDALARVPEWAREALSHPEKIAARAERYRYAERCVILGRGYNYATAFEWALKLKELTYITAEPYSSADFLHGPIALVERGFPVAVIAPSGVVYPEMETLLRHLREAGAECIVVSDKPAALALAQTPLPIPEGIPAWLSPLISILPAQIFAYGLTRAKGLDTERPRGLHKVTKTR